jgi:16S rRNA (guanine966-N2)-methyltransferase
MCTFVDLAADCCDCIQRNLIKCQLDGGTVVQADFMTALKDPVSVGIPEGSVFQLVTMSPPYEEVVYGDMIEAVINSPLVAEDTFILLEYPVELGCLPHVIRRKDGGAVVGVRNRRYGRTVVAIYIVNPTCKFETADSRPEEFIKLK